METRTAAPNHLGLPRIARTALQTLLVGVVAALRVGLDPSPAAAAVDPGLGCEKAASAALSACVRSTNTAARRCYLTAGNACSPADPRLSAALARLERRVASGCPDAATVGAAGYGPLMTRDALIDRLAEACLGEAASLAARSFGGPHGAVLAGILAADDQTGQSCLTTAHRRGATVMEQALRMQSECVLRDRRGLTCDQSRLAAGLASATDRAVGRIEDACEALPTLIGLDATSFVGRGSAEARCMVVTAHPDSSPLALDCGPRSDVPVPARGQAVQVILDEAVWGTRCGNGSPYAFWVRLAPAESPAEKVLVHMQGGGVCVFENDCNSQSPGLFEALGDGLPQSGCFSTDPMTNPFANWTQVYLPYCTQDVHIGGGLTSAFPSITVHRYGAVNVRAALRYVRDLLWAELDATTVEGFRPDRLRVLFGGTSAGAFGASYNYHYLLDDLRWIHTTAVPDAALGLDNGTALSVRGLGALLILDSGPLGWGSRPFLPPYCIVGDCAVVPELQAATSPRLLAVPDQQILNVSNQVDNTQRSTTFFPDMQSWINELRESYCTNQGLPGLFYFLPAVSTSFHGTLTSNARFPSLTSDGATLGDWLAGAFSSPAAVVDRVEEGTLVADYGANPFACPVGSP